MVFGLILTAELNDFKNCLLSSLLKIMFEPNSKGKYFKKGKIVQYKAHKDCRTEYLQVT